MRAGGSKEKGSQFERDRCRDLSLWATNGAKEDEFWRSAMSGGRATVKRKVGKLLGNQAGDVSAIGIVGHELLSKFIVECKFYKDLGFSGAVWNEGGNIGAFWKKLLMECNQHHKQPFLIAKQNKKPTLLGVTFAVADGIISKTVLFPLIVIPSLDLHLFKFDLVINQIPYDDFCAMVE